MKILQKYVYLKMYSKNFTVKKIYFVEILFPIHFYSIHILLTVKHTKSWSFLGVTHSSFYLILLNYRMVPNSILSSLAYQILCHNLMYQNSPILVSQYSRSIQLSNQINKGDVHAFMAEKRYPPRRRQF